MAGNICKVRVVIKTSALPEVDYEFSKHVTPLAWLIRLSITLRAVDQEEPAKVRCEEAHNIQEVFYCA